MYDTFYPREFFLIIAKYISAFFKSTCWTTNSVQTNALSKYYMSEYKGVYNLTRGGDLLCGKGKHQIADSAKHWFEVAEKVNNVLISQHEVQVYANHDVSLQTSLCSIEFI